MLTHASTVKCCFKCCYERYIAAYNLGEEYGSFAPIAAEKVIPLPLKEISSNWTNLIYGYTSPFSLSSFIISEQGQTGNISVMQITTLSTHNSTIWSTLKGRRVVLLTPIEACVEYIVARNAMIDQAPFGNPRISSWYTTQLPCNFNLERKKGDEADRILEEKMHLIPMGVRSPQIMSAVLSAYMLETDQDVSIDKDRDTEVDRSLTAASNLFEQDLYNTSISQRLNSKRRNLVKEYMEENERVVPFKVEHVSKNIAMRKGRGRGTRKNNKFQSKSKFTRSKTGSKGKELFRQRRLLIVLHLCTLRRRILYFNSILF